MAHFFSTRRFTPSVDEASNKMIKRRKSTPPSTKPIPANLMSSIFSKLPVKTLVRFKCLDTLSFTIINDPSFAKIHKPLHISNPGRLLITCPTKLQSSQKFFTADQNGGPATCCLDIPPRFSRYITTSVNGLVCMDFGILATVCNPSTRQAITLKEICPKTSVEARYTCFCVNYLGFDPKNKEYKVLNSWSRYKESGTVYRVYTLGGPKEWRKLDFKGHYHYAQRESICIDGNIFFRSWVSLGHFKDRKRAVLICFNVETESLRAIRLPKGAAHGVERSGLIQIEGLLAIINYRFDDVDYHYWVLEDYEKEIWRERHIVFPKGLKKIHDIGENYVASGCINTGELMVVPQCLSTLGYFEVFYYNFRTYRIRRVEITGLPRYNSFDFSSNVVWVTNYMENILPLP